MRSVRIFVSSPADAGHERDRLARVVARLNAVYGGVVRLELFRWEDAFYRADDTFQRQIPEAKDCDLVVGVLNHRLGSPLPGDFPRMPAAEPFRGEPYASGTAYEILSSIAARTVDRADKPDIYVFRRPDPPLAPVGSPQADSAAAEWRRLEAFARRFFFTEQGEFRFAFHGFRNTDDFDRQVEALLRLWIEQNVFAGRRAVWPVEVKGSPFRALAAFDAGHRDVFFGRDREIARAVEVLGSLAAEQKAGRPVAPFLLVFGASGAGKSSFARAGLAPALRRAPGDVAEWRVAVTRPTEAGLDPFSALALRLFDDVDREDPSSARALPELRETSFATPEALAALLRHADASAVAPVLDALGRAAARLAEKESFEAPPEVRLLVVVDQFDDVFAGQDAAADADRAAFARLLAALAASGAVSVVATLRTALYERLSAEPDLKALKSLGATFELESPEAAELAAIVREPASAADLSFEVDPATGQSLDQRLLKDFDRPDMLPLLQFALSRLFEERRPQEGSAGVLTYAAYERMGGMAGAVQTAADRALGRLGQAERSRLPRLFRLLVEAAPAAAGRETGEQPLALVDASLAAFDADPALRRLADALTEERILVAGVGPDGAATLALAHRRVPELWTEAHEAVAANAFFYRVLAELRPAWRRWSDAGRPWKRLISDDILLGEGRRLAGDFPEETPPEIADFVARSRGKARLRTTVASALAVAFFCLAAGVGVLYVTARDAEQLASEQRDAARRSLRIARETIDGVVTDVADGLKDVEGMSTAARNRILGQVQRSVDELAAKAGDSAELTSTRWNVLISLGDAYLAAGEEDRAAKAFDEALGVSRGLPMTRETPLVRHQRSVSLDRVGDVAARSGDLVKAASAYEESLALRRGDDSAVQNDPRMRRDVSVSLEKLGDVKAEADPSAALKLYGDSLDIRRSLVADAPGDPDRRRDVSVSLSKIGDVLMRTRDPAGALRSYQEALEIDRALAAQDETNTDRRRDVSVNLDRVVEAKLRAGDANGALAAYAESRDIRRKLVEGDGANARWAADLAISAGNVDEAERAVRAAGSRVRSLPETGGAARLVALPASLRGGLEVLRRGAVTPDADVDVGRPLADGDEVRASRPSGCGGVKIFDGRALHDLQAGSCRYVVAASEDGTRVLAGLDGLFKVFAADGGRPRDRATVATESRGDDAAEPLALADVIPRETVQSIPAGASSLFVLLRHGASDFTYVIDAGAPLTTRSRRATLPLPSLDAGAEGSVAVTDADGARVSIPFRVTPVSAAPSPIPGLPMDALVGDDRAAYGYWLLTAAAPEWRLFGLSLLGRAAGEGCGRAEAFLARLARGS